MKTIKSLLCLCLAFILIFSITACDTEQTESAPSDVSSSVSAGSSTDTNSSADTSSVESEVSKPAEKHKYDSETLVFSHVSKKTPTSDSKKKYIEIGELGKFEIDKENNISINEYTVFDYNGKVVYFFKSPINNKLVVFSIDDGTVYLNEYTSNKEKGDYDNTVLTFKDPVNDKVYDEVDSIQFKDTYTAGFVAKINGKYYHNKIGSIAKNDPYLLIYEIPDCNKVYELGYRSPYSAVCYSKKDIDNAVFFYCGDYDYTVNLPEGYTVDDIEQLTFGLTVVAVMKDKTVCTVTADRNAKEHSFVINEEITQLNKDKKVKSISISNYNGVCDVLVAMDDGNVYKIIQ